MGRMIYQWNFDPLMITLTGGIIVFYYVAAWARSTINTSCFWVAILLILTATCSPLHFLGMHYYFSAHMIVHIILLLICGPLLVVSIPQGGSPRLIKAISGLSSFFYRHVWLAWIAGVGIMWFWHVPAVFNASQGDMRGLFHVRPLLHTGSMLLAGMMFSWPLFSPVAGYRIHALSGVVYLFTACISCSLLGLLITFAPASIYHHYMEINAAMNMTAYNPWGISPQVDQQAAGLIMWVPCCFVYLAGCLYLLQRWLLGNSAPNSEQLML